MKKPINRPQSFFLISLFFFAAVFTGCDKGSSSNSKGPTSPSNYMVNLTASNMVVRSGGSSTITVTVYDSLGNLADGVTVNFSSDTGVAPTSDTTTNGVLQTVLSGISASTTITATVEDASVQLRIMVSGATGG